MKFAFMLYDEESTGSITHRELVKILRANHMAKTEAEVSRKAETIIAQCDKHSDGVITFDEFVIVSRKFPNILFPRQQDNKEHDMDENVARGLAIWYIALFYS